MAEKQSSFKFPLPTNSDGKVWLHGLLVVAFDRLFDRRVNMIAQEPDQHGITLLGSTCTVSPMGEGEYREISITIRIPKQ